MIDLVQKSSMKDVLFDAVEYKGVNSITNSIQQDCLDVGNPYKPFSSPHVTIEEKLKNMYQFGPVKRSYTH
jgi:hypothetical protein